MKAAERKRESLSEVRTGQMRERRQKVQCHIQNAYRMAWRSGDNGPRC
jgi:hypothetical protein